MAALKTLKLELLCLCLGTLPAETPVPAAKRRAKSIHHSTVGCNKSLDGLATTMGAGGGGRGAVGDHMTITWCSRQQFRDEGIYKMSLKHFAVSEVRKC